MSEIGDRGKWAEGEVHKKLKLISNQVAEFDFERPPDARAARGALKAQVGDFVWYLPGGHGVVEVKESKHDFRVAKDKLAQLPKLRKRALAGGNIKVIVYHSALNKWRVAPLFFFDGPIPPSWDLSSLPLIDSISDIVTLEVLCG